MRHKMPKISIIFCCVFIIFMGACVEKNRMAEDIERIVLLEKPKLFQPIDIHSTLEKYIDIGMSEKYITDTLTAAGFSPYSIKTSQSSGKNMKKIYWYHYHYPRSSTFGPLFRKIEPFFHRFVIEIELTDQSVSAYLGYYMLQK